MPLWQMTGEEFFRLTRYANGGGRDENDARVTGNSELAEFVGCSVSTICKMKKTGLLNRAVLSDIGRSTVYDGNLARDIIKEYTHGRRNEAV